MLLVSLAFALIRLLARVPEIIVSVVPIVGVKLSGIISYALVLQWILTWLDFCVMHWMSQLLMLVVICAVAQDIYRRFSISRAEKRGCERRRRLLVDKQSLSGTDMNNLVTETLFDSSTLAGFHLLPIQKNGLPAKRQKLSLKVIGVGTGLALRVIVKVQHAPFPHWPALKDDQVMHETKERLVRIIQHRMAECLTKRLVHCRGSSPKSADAALRVAPDDITVVLMPIGSRMMMDSADLSCSRFDMFHTGNDNQDGKQISCSQTDAISQ